MKSVYEYHGWKYEDKGEDHHPAGSRWQAIYQGVQVQRGSEMSLITAIDARRMRYPGSNGA